MNDHPNPPAPKVIVIRQRPGRTPGGVACAVLAIALAAVAMLVRVALPDWRGLAQEVGRGLDAYFAKPAKPIAVAGATPAPKMPEAQREAPAPNAPGPPPAVAKTPDAWDEIKRASERVAAERAEAERQKAEAERQMAEAPPPPPAPRRRGNGRNPADILAFQRRQEAMMRRMEAMMAQDFERMAREQDAVRRRFFGEMADRFGPPPPPLPGMDRFAAPLPGMDRFFAPMPRPPAPGLRDGRQGAERPGRGRNGNSDPSRWGV